MDDTLAKLGAAVGARLRERRETIAVSESSTGGLISAALLVIPRVAYLGGSIFGVVMAGAIYTHATHNETSRLPFNLLLLSLALAIAIARWPRLRAKQAVSTLAGESSK